MESGISRSRRSALITGANGGMGRALARAFGETMDLVLTDIAAAALVQFVDELRNDGYRVTADISGDFGDPSVLDALLAAAASSGGLGVFVHAAAVAPAAAGWERIMEVNLISTARLLKAVETILQPGSVALVIASNSGHLYSGNPAIDAILDKPSDPKLIDRLRPLVAALADPAQPDDDRSISYMLSKRGVLRLCERTAPDWMRRLGARIVTISPGLVYTPMGRAEHENNPRVPEFLASVPGGRWVTVMDVVAAARFLVSDGASFISGCDLRVDGAHVAQLLHAPA